MPSKHKLARHGASAKRKQPIQAMDERPTSQSGLPPLRFTANEPVGLLAGHGRFPFVFAEKARSLSIPVVCVGIRHEASADLASLVQRFFWAGPARLGRMI